MQEYELLEERFGEFIDNPNVVVCSSGTAALHLAFEVLRASVYNHDNYAGPEQRLPEHIVQVAVPDIAMIACPRAVTSAGLVSDLLPVTELGLLDGSQVDDVNKHTGVLALHLYGRRCDTEFLDAYVVEDLAEAHGMKPNKDSFAACWSFYRNKIIHGEEGGAVAFRDQTNAELARELRTLGMTNRHDFMHKPRGMNYRLSNANADPIIKSLSEFDNNLLRRRRVEVMYNEVIPKEWQLPQRDIPWVYDLELPEETDTWQVVQQLIARGIAARQCFKPMSWQPEFKKESTCPNAERIAKRRLYLPIHPAYQRETVNRIGQTLTKAVESGGSP